MSKNHVNTDALVGTQSTMHNKSCAQDMKKICVFFFLLGGISYLSCMDEDSKNSSQGIHIINKADCDIEIVVADEKTEYKPMPTPNGIVVKAHSVQFVPFDNRKQILWIQNWFVAMIPASGKPFSLWYTFFPAAKLHGKPMVEKQDTLPSLQELCLMVLKNNNTDVHQESSTEKLLLSKSWR